MRRMILALLVAFSMTAASPVAAAEGPILGLEGIWTWLVSFWSSNQERGPGLDPDGLMIGDRGLEIDPDELMVDRGPELDPDGLSAGGKRGLGIDPNG